MSITGNDQDFIDSFDCDVYEKDSLFHYTEYPSKSAINKNDLSFSNVESSSECASKYDSQIKNNLRIAKIKVNRRFHD